MSARAVRAWRRGTGALCALLLAVPLRAAAGDILTPAGVAGTHAVVENVGSTESVDALAGMENLTIHRYPGGAVLRGELLSPRDLRRVALVSASSPGILNLCTLHPDALQLAADRINALLAGRGLAGLELVVFGETLVLTGTPAEEGDVQRVQRICKEMGLPLVDGTRPVVEDGRMVRFEVSFTEVNRDAFRQMGVRWPASTALADPAGMRVGRLSPAQSLEVTIDHLVRLGRARIISKPSLVCGSGKSASFQAGGELPIPKTDEDGRVSITWKPYGILLSVSPVLAPDGTIHTGVSSEVSMVDHANAVEGIPGILTRKVETHLSLRPGQTVVLSGLVHSDDAERVTKVPLLGDIPILGELFRSKSFQKRETELVVFLRPAGGPVDMEGLHAGP